MTSGPRKAFAFSAAPARAELVRRRLAVLGAFDGSRRAVQRADRVLFPVLPARVGAVRGDGALSSAGGVVEADLPSQEPRAPADAVVARLRHGGWSDDDLAAVPRQWHLVGDVALVKLPSDLRDEAAFAEALAGVLGARAVLEDLGVEGRLRRPRTRPVWGDRDTRTVHVERGVRFALDPARVMFSAGNVSERGRLLDVVSSDEVVVDLFAGVGYFTLPLAVHAGCHVHACELNPVSAAFLRDGIGLNDVESLVSVHEGDARVVAPRRVADRVVLGYVHGTLDFVPTAIECLGPHGGVLHVHETATVEEGAEGLALRVTDAVRSAGRDASVLGARRVKNFAPGIVHAVVDVEVAP